MSTLVDSHKMEKHLIDGLNCYVKHITTNKYNDYIIPDFFGDYCTFKRSDDMRVTGARIF